MLVNAIKQSKTIVEHGYMCLLRLSRPSSVKITKDVKYKKILLLICIHNFKWI